MMLWILQIECIKSEVYVQLQIWLCYMELQLYIKSRRYIYIRWSDHDILVSLGDGMKNKQYEYILKAYTCSGFPRLLYEELSDMMLAFEMIDSMALDVLKGKTINRPNEALLLKEEKDKISSTISNLNIDSQKREELMFFYRLTILVIGILEKQYQP